MERSYWPNRIWRRGHIGLIRLLAELGMLVITARGCPHRDSMIDEVFSSTGFAPTNKRGCDQIWRNAQINASGAERLSKYSMETVFRACNDGSYSEGLPSPSSMIWYDICLTRASLPGVDARRNDGKVETHETRTPHFVIKYWRRFDLMRKHHPSSTYTTNLLRIFYYI